MGINFVNSFNLKWVSFLFGTMLLLNAFPVRHGCSIQRKRRGDNVTLLFHATTVNSEDPALLVANVIKSPNDSTLLNVLYRNGNLVNTPECNGCTFTGDATTGNLAIRLDNLQASYGGTYKNEVGGKNILEKCISLFILDIPTKPSIKSNKDPLVGESVSLTCSSTSRTTPSNHGLTLTYNWIVDGKENPSDARYSYSTKRKTLTMSNVVKTDASKPFTCTATEDVNEGYTSDSSNSFSPNVLSFPVRHGCSIQRKRRGDNVTLLFHATTVNSEDPALLVANVIKSPNDSTLLNVLYRNGNLVNTPECNGCTFTGDATTGNLAIRLDNLQASYGGTYKNEVGGKNILEKCISLFILDIPTKPSIKSNKDPLVGESVTLTCSSTSRTTPSNHGLTLTYNWIVDGKENPSDARYSYSTKRKTLTMSNVVKTDASKPFTCTATEDVNEGYTSDSSNSFSPNVLYGPEELTFGPSATHYEREENATLGPVTCASACNPPCSFMWKNVDKGTVVNRSVVLTLNKITSSEAGRYQCAASRSGTYSLTKDLTVNVIYGPRQIKFSSETTIYREDEYSNIQDITCSSDCYVCEYSWTGPNAFSSNQSVLSLGRINRTMAGTYICTAKNTKSSKQAEQRKYLSIEVRYGPDVVRLTPGDSSYIVNEGTHINNIRCSADCFPNCTYKWTKDGQSTPVSEGDLLTVGTAQRSHTGTYTCTAVNGETSSKPVQTTVSIVVRYAPDVSIELSTTNITEGASLTLFCNGSGVPSVYKYVSLTQTWNNTEINNANRELAGTMRNSSIHFNQLQLQDSGTYTCTLNNGIENKYGILNQASWKNLLVKVRPKILEKELTFAGVTKGVVNIQMPVYSHPNLTSASITRYDGMKIQSDNKYNLSILQDNVDIEFYNTKVTLSGNVISLTIRDLEEYDFGNYTIELRNSIDWTFSTFYVIVEGKPLPPTIFQYLPEYSVPTFLWQKDFNGGHEQSFVIETSVSGTGNWKDHTSIHENNLQYKINESFYFANITGLQPGVYNARIYATNSMGDSELVNLDQTFEITMNEEEHKHIVREKTDNTALIVGLTLGVICFLLAVYATYLTFWKMRHLKKGTKSLGRSATIPVYANTSFDSDAVRLQELESVTNQNQESSMHQYADLSFYTNTDKNTYEVIQKI